MNLYNMTGSILYTEDIREAMADSYLECCLHLVVLQGEASFQLEGKQYHVKENDCIIKPGASPITEVWASDDLRMKGVVITNGYLRKAVPKTHYQIKGMMSMLENPVMPMLPADTLRIVRDIEDIRDRYDQSYHLFYHDVVQRAVQNMILDMYDIHSRLDYTDLPNVPQGIRIFRQFISYLQTGLYRQERQVDYYASLLCITSKYLSEVCVNSSGHNASYWIDHFTSLEIARLLQHENLTLKDITYKFCFSSVNYFTRYVKRTLGMTPSDYRARHKAKE